METGRASWACHPPPPAGLPSSRSSTPVPSWMKRCSSSCCLQACKTAKTPLGLCFGCPPSATAPGFSQCGCCRSHGTGGLCYHEVPIYSHNHEVKPYSSVVVRRTCRPFGVKILLHRIDSHTDTKLMHTFWTCSYRWDCWRQARAFRLACPLDLREPQLRRRT